MMMNASSFSNFWDKISVEKRVGRMVGIRVGIREKGR
jgi:hypothetical protein